MGSRVAASAALIGVLSAVTSCTAVYDAERHEGLGAGYCESVATIYCEAVQDCCAVPPSLEDCIPALQAECGDFAEAAADPRLGFTTELALEALARLEMLAADCNPQAYDLAVGQGVAYVIPGTKDEGEICTPDDQGDGLALLQCLDGLACLPSSATELSCSRAPLPGPGEECPLFVCRDDSYCNTGATPKLCEAKRENGEPCAHRIQCLSNVCVVPRTGGDAQCAPLNELSAFCFVG